MSNFELLIMQDNSNKTGNHPRNQTRSILTPSRLEAVDELLESGAAAVAADNMSCDRNLSLWSDTYLAHLRIR